MPISFIDPTFEFTPNVWVVSVMNTGSKVGGHAVMVVEGIYENQKTFFGQYDIIAEAYEKQGSSLNTRGKIIDIRIFESDRPTRNYDSYTRRAMYAHPKKTEAMIESIRIDKAEIEKGNFPEYQRYGAKNIWNFFGVLDNEYKGHNCSSWVAEKLKLAGIGAIGKKPKLLVCSLS